MNIIEYVSEEVRRQGHTETWDHIQRTAWMLDAWAFAMDLEVIDIDATIMLARMIEPSKNIEGIRTVGVRVGNRVCPAPQLVDGLLKELFAKRRGMNPLEFYKEFELIHPFVDGNGRTGKIILNYMSGTLRAPFFPPADLFGFPIVNP